MKHAKYIFLTISFLTLAMGVYHYGLDEKEKAVRLSDTYNQINDLLFLDRYTLPFKSYLSEFDYETVYNEMYSDFRKAYVRDAEKSKGSGWLTANMLIALICCAAFLCSMSAFILTEMRERKN